MQLAVENLDDKLFAKLTLVDFTNRFAKVLTDVMDENRSLEVTEFRLANAFVISFEPANLA